jgi:hypothetical protein
MRSSVERPAGRPDDAPIFVIGTGRSGTTLLRQMLDAHPRIHVAHEAAFYFYLSIAPREASVRAWLGRYFDTFSFAWLRIDPREILGELPAALPRARDADAIRALLRCKARQRGKPRYGEKNPLDTMSLGRIFADFADPRVVYVVRDPRATVASLGRMPWSTGSVLANSLFCRLQQALVAPFLDRILEVRLEDLAGDPRATMQTVLRFVGEPWDEAVLDHVRHARRDDVAPLPWFAAATGEAPSLAASEGGWRTALSPASIRLVERVNRAAMARYGYAAAILEAEPDAGDVARAGVGEAPEIARTAARVMAYRRRCVRHMRGVERFDPQEALEASLGFNPDAWRFYPGLRVPRVPATTGVSARPIT